MIFQRFLFIKDFYIFFLSLFLSFFFSIYLSIYLSLYLYLSNYLSLYCGSPYVCLNFIFFTFFRAGEDKSGEINCYLATQFSLPHQPVCLSVFMCFVFVFLWMYVWVCELVFVCMFVSVSVCVRGWVGVCLFTFVV